MLAGHNGAAGATAQCPTLWKMGGATLQEAALGTKEVCTPQSLRVDCQGPLPLKRSILQWQGGHIPECTFS